MRRLLKYIVTVATFLVLFLALNSVILRHSLVALVTVSGSSMYPSIYPGDMLLCVSAKLTGVQVGDVYVYSTLPGRYVVHRIVNQSGNLYLFKGDNNLHVDGYVVSENVICKVVLRIPRAVWITTLAVSLGVSYTYSLARKKRSEQLLSIAVVLIMVTVISTGVLTLREPDVYVKPNPTPVSTLAVVLGNRTFIAVDSWHLVESVECFSDGRAVPCRLQNGFVEVASVAGTIELRMKLRSCYNITVVETVEVG